MTLIQSNRITPARGLPRRFEAHTDWRWCLTASIKSLHDWLTEAGLSDPQVDLKVQPIKERLQQDRRMVAFVAEFSRSKSELINVIFFADFGQWLLPSTAGRTTACRREALHDPALPPSIPLLPFDTSGRDGTGTAFKAYPDEWASQPLHLAMAAPMTAELAQVSKVKSIPAAEARRYVLADDKDPGAPLPAVEPQVEAPCWRQAIISFPDPLLQQGLAILDAPGLNAVGTEPESTLSLLPSTQAVLSVLAADDGVTRSDLDTWTVQLAGEEVSQRVVRVIARFHGWIPYTSAGLGAGGDFAKAKSFLGATSGKSPVTARNDPALRLLASSRIPGGRDTRLRSHRSAERDKETP